MHVEHDFTQISSSFEPPKEGEHIFEVTETIDQAEDEEWKQKNAASPSANPAFIVVSTVIEGDEVSKEVRDYLYFKTKEGKPSKMGLGKLKAYAEAILGKEEANSPKGIDTEKLIGGRFKGIMKKEMYTDNKTIPPQQKETVRLSKILPLS